MFKNIKRDLWIIAITAVCFLLVSCFATVLGIDYKDLLLFVLLANELEGSVKEWM